MQIEISQTAWRRMGIGAAAVILLLGWAWWDGGEEAVRPMAHTVELPEVAQ